MVFGWMKKIWHKIIGNGHEEDNEEQSLSSARKIPAPLVLDYELHLKDKVHQIMATRLSKIARLYPQNFDLIKIVLMEYTAFIEEIIIFRETGKPEAVFNRLQSFIDINMKPFHKKESEELRTAVELEISDVLISIEETIAKYEQQKVTQGDKEELSTDSTRNEYSEFEVDWSEKIRNLHDKKGVKLVGRPSDIQERLLPTDPISKIKGIGKKKAIELEALGITTVKGYYDYLASQNETNTQEEEHYE